MLDIVQYTVSVTLLLVQAAVCIYIKRRERKLRENYAQPPTTQHTDSRPQGTVQSAAVAPLRRDSGYMWETRTITVSGNAKSSLSEAGEKWKRFFEEAGLYDEKPPEKRQSAMGNKHDNVYPFPGNRGRR